MERSLPFASASQAGKPGPIPLALIMAHVERNEAVHYGATDSILDQIGVNIDASILKEQPKAILTFKNVRQSDAEVGST